MEVGSIPQPLMFSEVVALSYSHHVITSGTDESREPIINEVGALIASVLGGCCLLLTSIRIQSSCQTTASFHHLATVITFGFSTLST